MSDVDDDNEWSDYDEDFEGAVDEFIADGPESEYDYGANVNIPGARPNNQPIMSLQANCLECIVGNFEKFNDAFKTSGDRVLLRSLTFLQRVYTSEVINGLHNKGMLADKYLDFLINEYLKELDIGKFVDNKCSLKVIEERIKQVGQSFTKVVLKSPYCYMEENTSEFLSNTVCHLSNVEVLDIPRHCNDTTLKNISTSCSELKELYIDYSPDVTDVGLEMLYKNLENQQKGSKLKVLSIKLVKLSNVATISFLLENMPLLEVLEYTHLPSVLYSMHEEDLKNNTLKSVKKYNLTKLDFSCSYDPKLEDYLKIWTAVCPNIITIFVNLRFSKELDLISHFSKLEDLTITTMFRDNREPLIELNDFFKSNGSFLKRLKVNHFAFSISNLIQNCPKLENLALSAVEFQKYVTKRQPSNMKLNNLRELCLEDITFSKPYAEDSVTDILLHSPNLERLSFKECLFLFENSEINTKLAKYCEDCSLQSLRFNNCNIELALLESIILTCPTLKSLTIDSCENISYDDVSNLQMLRNTASGYINIVYHDQDSDDESYVYTDYDDYSDDYDHYSDDYDDYDGYDGFEDHVWFG